MNGEILPSESVIDITEGELFMTESSSIKQKKNGYQEQGFEGTRFDTEMFEDSMQSNITNHVNSNYFEGIQEHILHNVPDKGEEISIMYPSRIVFAMNHKPSKPYTHDFAMEEGESMLPNNISSCHHDTDEVLSGSLWKYDSLWMPSLFC